MDQMRKIQTQDKAIDKKVNEPIPNEEKDKVVLKEDDVVSKEDNLALPAPVDNKKGEMSKEDL